MFCFENYYQNIDYLQPNFESTYYLNYLNGNIFSLEFMPNNSSNNSFYLDYLSIYIDFIPFRAKGGEHDSLELPKILQ